MENRMQEHRSSTTEMKMDVLCQHAADMGLLVEWRTDLPARRHGEYLHDERIVRLNYLLTGTEALAALAHELGHATFGDTTSTPAIERRADEFGATFIISAAEYAQAEEIVGSHPGAIARELGVTHRSVLAWRRWWAKHHGRGGGRTAL